MKRWRVVDVDTNIYQCPACGSKRVRIDPKSGKENDKVGAFIAAIFCMIGLFTWPWLILIGIVLGGYIAYKLPPKLRCYSCHRRWYPEHVKIIGQVGKNN